MGLHEHGEDEEMYIILNGEGIMSIEGEELLLNAIKGGVENNGITISS